MNKLQKTYSMKAPEISKKWYIIDAEGKVLGRLATRIAMVLRGKDRPDFTPHMDMGGNIVIINAEKVVLTGKKLDDKEYFHHTKHPGGKKFTNIKKYLAEKPEFVIEHAVWGMLPKNRISRKLMGHLKIYAGKDHPHAAQTPEIIENI